MRTRDEIVDEINKALRDKSSTIDFVVMKVAFAVLEVVADIRDIALVAVYGADQEGEEHASGEEDGSEAESDSTSST